MHTRYFLCLTQCVNLLYVDPLDLLVYTRGCFQYQRYGECIVSADQIIDLTKSNKLDQSVVNEAKLLKGKSLFFSYQNMQQVFLRRRGSDAIKHIEILKHECYEKARRAILLLGTAQDHGFLDEEGSKLLDYAMIDYLRETNNLNSCQRCLLCRKKTKLKRSHIFPKCILKEIATDLRKGEDHKVFSSMIGKVVKKSAGEATFGMLCGQCEQCLCQNGEEQFFKQIHSNICVHREVVKSRLKLTYGSWLYDFCIGILFRSFAVSQGLEVKAGRNLYKVFSDCRKHLLSLPTNTPSQRLGGQKGNESAMAEGLVGSTSSPLLPPNVPLQISFFVNPTVNVSPHHLKLEYILKGPALFMSPVSLDKGIYSHDKQPSVFLAHFDHMNILIQLQMATLQDGKINPHGGELVIPDEHERWQVIPTGVWKLFSAFAQASDDIKANSCQENIKSLEGGAKPNFLYFPENIVDLKKSVVFSLLPPSYAHRLDKDANKVAIQFPKSHQVLIHVIRQWGCEQEIAYLVTESSDVLYLVFVLSVPGWHIVDGLVLDTYNCRVVLPFLDGKKKEYHPLKLSVLQALVEQVPEIRKYLRVRTQLS